MRVSVVLHAALRELIDGGRGEMDIDTGTVADLLDTVGVDLEMRELVTLNGVQANDLTVPLSEGDTVEVFPAVAGGSLLD